MESKALVNIKGYARLKNDALQTVMPYVYKDDAYVHIVNPYGNAMRLHVEECEFMESLWVKG